MRRALLKIQFQSFHSANWLSSTHDAARRIRLLYSVNKSTLIDLWRRKHFPSLLKNNRAKLLLVNLFYIIFSYAVDRNQLPNWVISRQKKGISRQLFSYQPTFILWRWIYGPFLPSIHSSVQKGWFGSPLIPTLCSHKPLLMIAMDSIHPSFRPHFYSSLPWWCGAITLTCLSNHLMNE